MSNRPDFVTDGSPERTLWLAVIGQAIEDSIEPIRCPKDEIEETKCQAKAFLQGTEHNGVDYSNWLEDISGFFGKSPEEVKEAATKFYKERYVNVRQRTKGLRYTGVAPSDRNNRK